MMKPNEVDNAEAFAKKLRQIDLDGGDAVTAELYKTLRAAGVTSDDMMQDANDRRSAMNTDPRRKEQVQIAGKRKAAKNATFRTQAEQQKEEFIAMYGVEGSDRRVSCWTKVPTYQDEFRQPVSTRNKNKVVCAIFVVSYPLLLRTVLFIIICSLIPLFLYTLYS